MVIAAVCLLIGALTGIVLAVIGDRNETARLPEAVQRRTLFPIYLPGRLPDGFSIDPNSYDTAEGVLLFYASNKQGQKIVFTQQPKPQDFDFSRFNQSTLKQAERVIGAPYPSVIGMSEGGTVTLSVQTDSTWILVISNTDNPRIDLGYIAGHLKSAR
jgi:hypothetical protein